MSVRVALLLLAANLWAERHVLPSNPKTVHWGYYDAAQPPVLRINPETPSRYVPP